MAPVTPNSLLRGAGLRGTRDRDTARLARVSEFTVCHASYFFPLHSVPRLRPTVDPHTLTPFGRTLRVGLPWCGFFTTRCHPITTLLTIFCGSELIYIPAPGRR